MTGIGKVHGQWRAWFRDCHLGDFPTKRAAIAAVRAAQSQAGLYVAPDLKP